MKNIRFDPRKTDTFYGLIVKQTFAKLVERFSKIVELSKLTILKAVLSPDPIRYGKIDYVS